jgi:signal transduction histidine kinase
LIGMRERLSLVDGECMIDSRPGAGTRIIARVGLRPDLTRAAAERQAHSA